MKKKISVSIDETTYTRIMKYRDIRNCTLSSAVNDLLARGLESIPSKKETFKGRFKELQVSFHRVEELFAEIESKSQKH